MEGKERSFPGVPPLLRLRFAVPIRTVVKEWVEYKEEGHGEGRDPIVGDWQEVACGIFLGILNCHDVLWHVGFVGPVFGEFSDERDNFSDFEASDLVRKVVEEGGQQHNFVLGVVVAEGDAMHLLEGLED